MRAYKTISWITDYVWSPSYYHKEKLQWLESNGFVRKFWHYICEVWSIRVRVDTQNWGYIDYQDISWHRISPNKLQIKIHKELDKIIKWMKEAWIIA